MTTHTDRKGADILAALDKLAENGMPFVDVVKRDGFSGWGVSPVDSAKHVAAQEARNQLFDPLRGGTVQIHEDPGAAYWKEATKMAEHTDRIGQFLEQSGVGFVSEEFPDIWQLHMHAGRDELIRFAQLVAEDCARVCAAMLGGCHDRSEYDAYSPDDAQTIGWVDALNESQKRIRARYSLATPSQAG